MFRKFVAIIIEPLKSIYLRGKKIVSSLFSLLKKYSPPYVLGSLFFILIVLVVFIIRNVNLTNAEIGLIAALLGGIVSGGLTLIGVKATLDNQDRDKFINLYPKRKMILDQEFEKMTDIIVFLNNGFGKNLKTVYISDFNNEFNKKRNEFKAFIEKSIVINGEVYSITKEFLKQMEVMRKCIKPLYEGLDMTTGENSFVGYYVSAENDYKQGLITIMKCRLKIKDQIKDLDNKYEKITGM